MKFKQYFLVTIVGLAVGMLLIVLDAFGVSHFNLPLFVIIMAFVAFGAWEKPRWAFWLFLMLLPLEKIVISPAGFPFSVRSYQLVGFVLVLILIIKWTFKKLDFKLLSFRKICFLDKLVFLLIVFALPGIMNSPDRAVSIKLTLVLISFIALFWLVRNFLQTKTKQLEALWFFTVGSVPVLLFGLYQAIAFRVGWPHFEVFNARINSTFFEPDWFGIYLVFLFALELLFLLVVEKVKKRDVMIGNFYAVKLARAAVFIDIFLITALLFLTGSRSAWIGAVVVGIAYFVTLFFVHKKAASFIGRNAAALFLVIIVSFLFVDLTGLSKFHFANRATSSVSGMQKITISCEKGTHVPRQIEHVSDLDKYSCRHINLEEIENELEKGRIIKETYRLDPNVIIRKNIYAKSWEEIKQHPILGQGLGSSAVILGTDERGSGFNTSNIFLEVWLSMGIGGLVIMIWILLYPVGKSKLALFAVKRSKKKFEIKKQLGLIFIFLTSGAIIIPNLFNSGLLLGFFWVWLAGVISMMDEIE